MKKSIKFVLLLLAAVMSVSLTACSSDDEPVSAGEKALAELNERLHVDGKFRFQFQAEDGQYYGYCENQAHAKQKAEEMLGHELENDAYTLILPEDYGYVKVVANEDPTIYYTMTVALKGDATKICNITDIAWFENHNFSTLTSYVPKVTL